MILVRDSRDGDLEAITRIYARNVLEGTGTFEEEPPGIDEIAARRADVIARGLPWLVAEEAGAVLGYAYAAPYRLRSAYRFALEDSIYLLPEAGGHGTGARLLEVLLDRMAAAGARQVVAVIGDSANHASVRLHARAGFQPAGVLKAVGFKFGRWLDVVLMQLPLGDGDGTLPTD